MIRVGFEVFAGDMIVNPMELGIPLIFLGFTVSSICYKGIYMKESTANPLGICDFLHFRRAFIVYCGCYEGFHAVVVVVVVLVLVLVLVLGLVAGGWWLVAAAAAAAAKEGAVPFLGRHCLPCC